MKLDTVDTDLARERLTRLFQYLAELQKLKTPPKVQLKAYSWQLTLSEIEADEYVVKGEILPPTEDGEVLGDDFILKISKPEDESHPASAHFEKFLELWSTIERESEKVELLLGEALVLQSASSGPVHHPILLQMVSLEFDPAVPEFTVRETDREPLMDTPVLRYCGVAEEEISWARTHLHKTGCHPLGGEETTKYLEDICEKLFPDGKVITDPNGNERAAKSAKIIRNPVLYLGNRTLGISQAIDKYLELLPGLKEFPPALLRVIGMDTPKEKSEEPIDLLMTMPSNPEQERVAKRLAESACVLVQGPPGTGKTHTIANLVGHLLAQGKSILVTSHASKALRVVRDMVIPELRPLCVSVLDQEQESRKQLEQAVKGIVARFTTSDVDQLEKLASTYQDRRRESESRLEETQSSLVKARRSEYEPILVGDEATHPARAARLVQKGLDKHDWIPGEVRQGEPLPLTPEQFDELYRLNREVPAELEEDLKAELPELDDLMTESDFMRIVERLNELEDDSESGGIGVDEFFGRAGQSSEQLKAVREAADRVLLSIGEEREWALECMRVGRLGGTQQETWEEMVRTIEMTAKELTEKEAEVLSRGAKVDIVAPPAQIIKVGEEILEHLRAGKNISNWTFLTKSNWKDFIYNSQVDGGYPQTPEQMEILIDWLKIKMSRTALGNRWQSQMEPKGAATFQEMGEQPETVCLQYCQPMRDALDWESKVWQPFLTLLNETGIHWQAIESRVGTNPSLYGDFLRIREAIEKQLKPALESRKAAGEIENLRQKIRNQEKHLVNFSGSESGGIVERLRNATSNLDVEGYSRAWNWLSQLYSLAAPVRKRDGLLQRLEAAAPDWARSIRAHEPPHDGEKAPGDVEAAWDHSQWTQELERRQEVEFDDLQRELMKLRSQLRAATAHYVENKTWANQLKRTGVRQQQALVGWLDLMRKIGSGKGKRAPRLKAMAREKLADCRDAVPVWIMPLSRVAESYLPGDQMFDVVILDEASQCEVTGLLAFTLGREVLVVGDHEQVSPEAVGLSFAAIEALIEEFLSEIPNRELYDGRTSVYDLARQSFGGSIRLLEHFRCVNEIIAFSNSLCYQGEIQPLREGSRLDIKPATVSYQVPNAKYERKVNRREAEMIAALVVACCEQPEYEGADMGVISLVGEEQALAVDRLLTKHLELTEYQERRLVCGNAAQFQGDERSVIFLSMVETSDGSALPLRTTDVFVKRFNVAASRAKDQMWVVHSLDVEEELKEGDLRKRLIEHCEDPYRTIAELEESRETERSIADDDPEFRYQIRVRRALEKAGYQVFVDQVVGNYQLDLVVQGRHGRAAITCDGANEHPPELLAQALEREGVLERLGWKFIRARASEYYLDADRTVERILERLEELDIEPAEKGSVPEETARGEEIKARIVKRAQELLAEWGLSDQSDGEVEEKSLTKTASIAERLEKKIKRIRSIGESNEPESEPSGEDDGKPKKKKPAKKKKRRGLGLKLTEGKKGKRLTGWRNLVPLDKGKKAADADKKDDDDDEEEDSDE